MTINNNHDLFLKRTDTTIIKAIAVYMMIYHHSFGFPGKIFFDNLYLEMFISGYSIQSALALVCKMCVALFAFLTGYGTYANEDPSLTISSKQRWKSCFIKIFKILIVYWVILFVVYIPIHAISSDSTSEELLKNIFLINTSYNRPAWYLSIYIFFVIFLTVFIPLFKAVKKLWVEIAIILLGAVAGHFIVGDSLFLHYLPIVITGVLCSKYKVYDSWEKAKNHWKWWILFFGVLLVFFGIRVIIGDEVYGIPMMMFIVPMIIFFLSCILHALEELKGKGFAAIENVFLFVGKYSMYYWLLHALFQIKTIAFLQKIVYFPRLSLLIVAWTILLLTPLALAFHFVISKLQKAIFK